MRSHQGLAQRGPPQGPPEEEDMNGAPSVSYRMSRPSTDKPHDTRKSRDRQGTVRKGQLQSGHAVWLGRGLLHGATRGYWRNSPSEQAAAPLPAAGLDQEPAHHAPGLAASLVSTIGLEPHLFIYTSLVAASTGYGRN